MPDVKITVTENGPLSVKGPITLVDQDGNEYDVGARKRVALCRCCGSTTKPFCDGTHESASRPPSAPPRSPTVSSHEPMRRPGA